MFRCHNNYQLRTFIREYTEYDNNVISEERGLPKVTVLVNTPLAAGEMRDAGVISKDRYLGSERGSTALLVV